jgi:hypothetical protein
MAHADLHQILNSLLPFADEILQKHGEFLPFGSTMNPDGEITMIAGFEGEAHPPSQAVIEFLTETFRAQAATGQLRAAGICCDVLTIPPGETEKCDALRASMEHQSGEAVEVFLPSKKTDEGGIQYGEMFAAQRIPEIFSTE